MRAALCLTGRPYTPSSALRPAGPARGSSRQRATSRMRAAALKAPRAAFRAADAARAWTCGRPRRREGRAGPRTSPRLGSLGVCLGNHVVQWEMCRRAPDQAPRRAISASESPPCWLLTGCGNGQSPTEAARLAESRRAEEEAAKTRLTWWTPSSSEPGPSSRGMARPIALFKGSGAATPGGPCFASVSPSRVPDPAQAGLAAAAGLLAGATGGALTVNVEVTPEADPQPGVNEVTVTEVPLPRAAGCSSDSGCVQYRFAGRGLLMGARVVEPRGRSVSGYVHDGVGHGSAWPLPHRRAPDRGWRELPDERGRRRQPGVRLADPHGARPRRDPGRLRVRRQPGRRARRHSSLPAWSTSRPVSCRAARNREPGPRPRGTGARSAAQGLSASNTACAALRASPVSAR